MSDSKTNTVISSRALQVMRSTLSWEVHPHLSYYEILHWSAERCLLGFHEEMRTGRLAFDGRHLRYDEKRLPKCGETTSREIWRAIGGTSGYYTAEALGSERILVKMPGCEYVLTQEEAQKLKDSIHDALLTINTMRYRRAQEEEVSAE